MTPENTLDTGISYLQALAGGYQVAGGTRIHTSGATHEINSFVHDACLQYLYTALTICWNDVHMQCDTRKHIIHL